MGTLGYVNNAYLNSATGEYTHTPIEGVPFDAIDPSAFSWDVSSKIRMLVAILYLVAGIMQFIGLGLVYNLDKKTLEQMNEELDARHAATEVAENA